MPEFRVKLNVTKSDHEYHVEISYGGQMFGWRSFQNIGDVEEYVSLGREELDLYEELRQYGGEYVIILAGLHRMGMARFPQLEPLFQKYEEERFGEVTEEERRLAERAWEEVVGQEWVLVWGPEDVEWDLGSARDREIYRRKYRYDELMAKTVDDVRNIARVKGLSYEGRKEEVARRIHQFDYGEEEARQKLREIGEMLGVG